MPVKHMAGGLGRRRRVPDRQRGQPGVHFDPRRRAVGFVDQVLERIKTRLQGGVLRPRLQRPVKIGIPRRRT